MLEATTKSIKEIADAIVIDELPCVTVAMQREYTQEEKMQIGIYKILNTVSNKFYVGSASRSFRDRWYVHRSRLNSNTHHNPHLQASWNKYQKDAFIFIILEVCSENEIIPREQYYLDTLKPPYNVNSLATSRLGVKASAETKAKISKLHKGKKLSEEHKAILLKSITSRECSKDTRSKIGAAHKGKTISPEQKLKVSKAQKGRKKSAAELETLRTRMTGEANPTSKLKQHKVDEIRQLYASGNYKKAELGRIFNTSRVNIGDIISNKNWYNPLYIPPT